MGAMNELFAFFWELAQAIWENFNCAEGKIIVGALINFFLLIGTIVHLFGKDPKGALVRAFKRSSTRQHSRSGRACIKGDLASSLPLGSWASHLSSS